MKEKLIVPTDIDRIRIFIKEQLTPPLAIKEFEKYHILEDEILWL